MSEKMFVAMMLAVLAIMADACAATPYRVLSCPSIRPSPQSQEAAGDVPEEPLPSMNVVDRGWLLFHGACASGEYHAYAAVRSDLRIHRGKSPIMICPIQNSCRGKTEERCMEYDQCVLVYHGEDPCPLLSERLRL